MRGEKVALGVDRMGLGAEERDGKLYFNGTVNSVEEKNQIWNALKTVPDWEKDVVADIKVNAPAARWISRPWRISSLMASAVSALRRWLAGMCQAWIGPFLPFATAKKLIEQTHSTLVPQPDFQTNGPASYHLIPATGQLIGFIGAMTNLHFCESCNKLRLTCDGKLRPCLGSYLEFDLRQVLRAGCTDAELAAFFQNVVARKPKEHDFRHNYQPNRRMIAIGG